MQNVADGRFMLYNLAVDLAETDPVHLQQLTSALQQHRQIADTIPWK